MIDATTHTHTHTHRGTAAPVIDAATLSSLWRATMCTNPESPAARILSPSAPSFSPSSRDPEAPYAGMSHVHAQGQGQGVGDGVQDAVGLGGGGMGGSGGGGVPTEHEYDTV